MTSNFSDIFSRFYLRVKDYDIAALSEEAANEILIGYLRRTMSMPMVRRLFSAVSIDEDLEEIEFEMFEDLDEASDQDFVEEVLATGMVVAWSSPRYHSTLLTNQLLSNAEQKWYSQSAHLAEMKELYTKSQIDLRKLIRDRGYNNVVLNGAT